MYGAIYFKFTPRIGWRILNVKAFGSNAVKPAVWKYQDILLVIGKFHVLPKHGFCKPPHKLMAWTKR